MAAPLPLSWCKQFCRNDKELPKTMRTKRNTMIVTAAANGITVGAPNALIECGCVANSLNITVARFAAADRRAAVGGDSGELAFRLRDRSRERQCLARELHDTLLQGFFAASMLLHTAVEQTPSDLPVKLLLTRVLAVVQRAIDEGRAALQERHQTDTVSASLEEKFVGFRDEINPGSGVRLQIFALGSGRAVKAAFQEQMFLIGREAVINALRHSGATRITVEIDYRRSRVRVAVRDNGCGIDPRIVRLGRDSHWGLQGMRERAERIGGTFRIWSRPGAGTEVQISIPSDSVSACVI
jgi:signal transduction histidine kinase